MAKFQAVPRHDAHRQAVVGRRLLADVSIPARLLCEMVEYFSPNNVNWAYAAESFQCGAALVIEGEPFFRVRSGVSAKHFYIVNRHGVCSSPLVQEGALKQVKAFIKGRKQDRRERTLIAA